MNNRLRAGILCGVGAVVAVVVVGSGRAAVLGGSNPPEGLAAQNIKPMPPPNSVMTPANGAIVWKDATGAVVPFFLEFGFGGSAWTDLQGGMFADGNGIIWGFNIPATPGGIEPVYSGYNYASMPQYWDNTNCSGTPYVPYAHARFTFTLLDKQNGTSIRAVTDNASASMQFMQSSWDGSCHNTIVHVLVTPMSDAPIVTPPAQLPFTLPVHAEMLP